MNLPLLVNDTVGPSVPMKCGANGKTAKSCGPIFANLSMQILSSFSLDWEPAVFFCKRRFVYSVLHKAGGLLSKTVTAVRSFFFYTCYMLFLSPPMAKHYNRRRFRVEQLALSPPPVIFVGLNKDRK